MTIVNFNSPPSSIVFIQSILLMLSAACFNLSWWSRAELDKLLAVMMVLAWLAQVFHGFYKVHIGRGSFSFHSCIDEGLIVCKFLHDVVQHGNHNQKTIDSMLKQWMITNPQSIIHGTLSRHQSWVSENIPGKFASNQSVWGSFCPFSPYDRKAASTGLKKMGQRRRSAARRGAARDSHNSENPWSWAIQITRSDNANCLLWIDNHGVLLFLLDP